MNDGKSSVERLFQEIERLKGKPPSIQVAVRVEEVFSSLAENISTVLQSANYIEQLDLVRGISKKFVEVRDLDQLAQDILNGASTLIPFTDGSIGLVDEGVIRFPYAIGKNKDSVMHYETPVGKGLTGWVVLHRISQNVGDTSKDERYEGQIGDTNSELDVPIIYGNENLGVINIESNDFYAFTDKDVYLLETLADAAAIAIKNVQFLEQIEARTKIIERLTSTLEYPDVVELILETVFELIKCTEASVGVVDNIKREIRFTFASGPSKKEVEEFNISIDMGLTGWVVRNNQSVRVDDVTKDDRYEPQIQKTRSELDIPLLFAGKVIGVLNAESPNIAAFTEEDQHLLEDIAPYAALALRHAVIYEDIRQKFKLEHQLRGFSERRAIIGDVSGNIVHDVNGAVGKIRIDAKEIIEHSNENSVTSKAHKIIEHADKVTTLIQDFQNRRDNYLMKSGPLDVNEIIAKAIEEAEVPSNIVIVSKLEKNLRLSFAAKEQLKKVFLSIINNAVTAMPDGGELWIGSYQQGDSILVRIKDTGLGILKEDQPRIFNDDFSKNDKRQGLGFGLSWSRLYINSVQGDIELENSEVGKGTIFVVTLPVHVEGERFENEESNDGKQS